MTSVNELKIGVTQPQQYDPLVIRNENGEIIFRITKEGDLYQNERLITGDDELRKAVTAFMVKMTECMK